MKKEEFLSELESRLSGLPSEDINERIEFYSEAIDDRMEEGLSEEEAVSQIGSVDEVVNQIASETPLSNLIKEKISRRKKLKAWEIVAIICGFPIWLPLFIVGFVLALVFYILLWVMVIVAYSVEISLVVSCIAGFIGAFMSLASGEFQLMYLAIAILSLGCSVLLYFGCVAATKFSLDLTKRVFLFIKKKLIGRGKQDN